MYSFNVKKCVYPQQTKKTIRTLEFKKKMTLSKQLIFNMNDYVAVFNHLLLDTCWTFLFVKKGPYTKEDPEQKLATFESKIWLYFIQVVLQN